MQWEPRPKMLYLAQRRPGFTHDSFIRRWRQHGALAMSQPRWVTVSRYVHCDALLGTGIAGLSEDYDGVGQLWYPSLEVRAARAAQKESLAVTLADEAQTFREPVVQTRVLCRENVCFDTGGKSALKLFQVVRGTGSGDREAFRQAWLRKLPARASAMKASAARYVLNLPLPPDAGSSRWGLDCDLIEELGFADLAALEAGLAALRRMASDLPDARSICIGTHEVVLDDKDAPH